MLAPAPRPSCLVPRAFSTSRPCPPLPQRPSALCCVSFRTALRAVPFLLAVAAPSLHGHHHQVRYKFSVRFVGVVVTFYVASTRTLRPSPRKPLYKHSEHGRDDSRLRPPRHVRMDQVHLRYRSAAARFSVHLTFHPLLHANPHAPLKLATRTLHH